jgi:hypothetical protein
MNRYLKKLIEFPENLYYDIKFFCNDVKNEIMWCFQRIFRGYDDRWHWSIADELTPILIDCLNFYKKSKDGYPCDFKTREEWNNIIETMIEGFKAGRDLEYIYYKKFKSDDELVEEYNRLRKIKDKGKKLFAKYYDNLWS